jgi:hypothetical protein
VVLCVGLLNQVGIHIIIMIMRQCLFACDNRMLTYFFFGRISLSP